MQKLINFYNSLIAKLNNDEAISIEDEIIEFQNSINNDDDLELRQQLDYLEF